MLEEAQVYHVCSDSTPKVDIVFVHGLTGDSVKTWSNGADGGFWPKWLCDDLDDLSIFAVDYPASGLSKWAKQEMDLHELATHMLEMFAINEIGTRPLVFITHSLGGLLTKEMLRAAQESQDEDWNKLATNTQLVAFIATPHLGAKLAVVAKTLIPRLSSKHVDSLSNDNGYLSNLNQAYRDLAEKNGWASISYYEMHKTKKIALIVDSTSADPGSGSSRPVPIAADHISISKPKDKNAAIYGSIRYRIKKVIDDLPNDTPDEEVKGSFGAEDYGIKSENDRRTLLEKLIAADREHEYPEANNYQNKFAQRYLKHGLFTKERSKNDAILSAVQQRFFTHVYQTKICKGATEEEVASALQQHVIDPMTVSNGNGNSPVAILQALYFLTEQCHIRWDAA